MPGNPFGKNDPLAAGGGSAWGGAANAAPGGFGSAGADDYDVVEIVDEQPAAAAPSGPGLKGAGNTSSSNKNFALREANVSRREQEVRRREAALAARGAAAIDPMMIKNFPTCCPMVHHDIANDIPDYNKSLMRAGFMLFLLTCLTLLWNLTAVILALIIVKFKGSAASIWFFAALYVVVGIPGAWFTWYGRLYRALMRDGALSWAGFFFFILVHLAFAVFSAIAPPLSEDGVSTEGLAYAHTGWMPVIDLFKLSNGDGGYKFVAICYAVGASLWTLVGVASVVLMGRVYVKMRGGTKEERAAHAHMEMQKANETAGP